MRLKQWSLVVGLALGNLLGCSSASRSSSGSEGGIRSDRKVVERYQEFAPGTTDGKPSACIKWDKGSRRLSKPPRKAAKDNALPQPVPDREKKLQAQNENHPHS